MRGHVRLHGAERGGQALAPRRLLLHEGREVGQVHAGRGAGARGVVYADRGNVRRPYVGVRNIRNVRRWSLRRDG